MGFFPRYVEFGYGFYGYHCQARCVHVLEVGSMVVSVCPAANVAAPVEVVWELLSQPSNYDRWWDAHLERSVPEGPAILGQISYATSKALGRKWDVTFVVKDIQPAKHRIQLDVTLPFGIIDHATVICTPVDAVTCRVQYG
jgi:hypothetical protein